MRSILNIFIFLGSINSLIAQQFHRESIEIRRVVNDWFSSNSNKDIDRLRYLYDEKLIYYGHNLLKEDCLETKEKLFNKAKFFDHSLNSDILIEEYSSGIIKCDFIKKVTIGDKSNEYPSYLLLRKIQGSYKIVGESDKITDKNLKYSLDIGKKVQFKDFVVESETKADPHGYISLVNSFQRIAIAVLLILIGWVVYTKYLKPKVSAIDTPNKSTSNNISKTIPDEDELKLKGDKFEKYITTKFDSKYFKIKDWRSDKGHNGNFPESNQHPDLVYEFNHKQHSKKFAVECKFRQDLFNNYIEIQEYQINNYRNFQKEFKIPVYIVIGLGGNPEDPNELFLLPLDKVYKSKLYYNRLKEFQKGSNFFYDPMNEILS